MEMVIIKMENEEKKRESFLVRFIKELIPYVVMLIVVILIRTYIVTPIMVNGGSMLPTLSGGEIMLLKKYGDIKRFDVVVVNTGNDEIIKRVIAMPGESIACENGIIYVNGYKQEEEYSEGITSDFSKVVLKDNEYFVMGDNREESMDSRHIGPIKKDFIKGTTSLVLFPFAS